MCINLPTRQTLALGHTIFQRAFMRAGEGTRTPDPLFTRQALYQLSYSGATVMACSRLPWPLVDAIGIVTGGAPTGAWAFRRRSISPRSTPKSRCRQAD